MPISTRRRFFVSGVLRGLSAATLFSVSGCGTVFHPERKGQPAGKIDWAIFTLDAIGLVLFFIPGVIAFAVDFNNGCIYLPPEQQTSQHGPEPSAAQLKSVSVSTSRLTPQEIEEVVSAHCGQEVRLQPGKVRTHPLVSIDQFWGARRTIMRKA